MAAARFLGRTAVAVAQQRVSGVLWLMPPGGPLDERVDTGEL